MLHRTAAAAQPTRTMAYTKLFEVYRMQYDSQAGTLAVSASHKHCVMCSAALAQLRVSGRRNIYPHHTAVRVVSIAAATSMSPLNE